jgi:predicted lysophospholipase L1 biosynthesis ABC-type transport system permease subunit
MNQSEQPLEDIRVIRKLMEESSRFLSLSGLSGIIAGVVGLAGAWIAHLVIKANNPYIRLVPQAPGRG